jgi:hypothetical protein
MRRFGLSLSALAFAALVDMAAVQQTERTFVAVIDSDGLLTPIVVYDGQDWWNRWPWGAESDEIKALPLPRSLADIPGDWLPEGVRLPVNWTVLRPSGGRVAIRALNPTRRSGFQMMETIVIRTTFRKRRGEYFEDAAAIAGPGTLGRFVSPSRAESRRIREQVQDTIVKLQQDEIRRWLAKVRERGEPVPSLARVERVETPTGVKHVPLAPDAPMAFGLSKADVPVAGNRFYYYLSGEELYAMRAGDDCTMNLSTDGVIVVAEGRVVSHRLASHAHAEYCGDAAERVTPIAALKLSGKARWIMRDSVEDGFDYLLFDPGTGDSERLKGAWSERNSSGTDGRHARR